ncbi:Kdo domain containing protein [Flavobacterium sp. GT2N3]|uniref:Kdo domain containing protein n=1 Tax=unclassified Flavobacterium TaxID=196869 RepID=UPI003AAB7DF0
MICSINPKALLNENEIFDLIKRFHTSGDTVVKGNRNEIKFFKNELYSCNIKSFKKPIFINKIIYSYLRKSKAERSFEYGMLLTERGIGTPKPIAYVEKFDWIGLTESFYFCEHITFDFMFRDLVEMENFPNLENILRQFTRFSFDLHEKGIEFLDHSPGNTLIKETSVGNYDFLLVDLNRMRFHQEMTFNMRMKNLRKLVTRNEMIVIMSEEYSKLYHKSYDETVAKLRFYTTKFQQKHYKKLRIKSFFKN